VGDAEYAESDSGDHAHIDAPRQMLHAMHLAVDEIRVEVPMPDDMEAVLATLRAQSD
jgi:hypothetical protein